MPECLADTVRAADSVQVCAAAPTCGGRLLSGLRRTVVSKERISRCFFGGGENVESCPCRPENVLSTLWGTRATSGARADDGKQPEFTSGVKRSRRRASLVSAQRVLCKRAAAALWRRKRSPEPTTASSRNSLPALSAAAVVQVLCPYSVSCANGAWRTQTEGNLSRGGRRAPLTDGRKLAREEVVVDLRGSEKT